jgi:hypothetical protein
MKVQAARVATHYHPAVPFVFFVEGEWFATLTAISHRFIAPYRRVVMSPLTVVLISPKFSRLHFSLQCPNRLGKSQSSGSGQGYSFPQFWQM